MRDIRGRDIRGMVCAVCWVVLVAAAGTACRDPNPNTPIARATTPADGGGVITLSYVLRNPDTSAVTVEIDYLRIGEPAFLPATRAPGGEGLDNLEASPGGTVHTFLWDALQDLGPGEHAVQLRVTPHLGGTGTIAFTFGFRVRNTDLATRVADGAFARSGETVAATPTGGVLVIGGSTTSGAVDEVSPFGGAVIARATLSGPRTRAASVTALLDATGTLAICVLGGQDGGGQPLDTVARYDAAQDAWAELGTKLTDKRAGATATLLPGGVHVFLAGGQDAGGTLGQDVVYDPRGTGTTTFTLAPGVARTDHRATLLRDGRVLVTGGLDAGGSATSSTWLVSFDAQTATATRAVGPPLQVARSGHVAIRVGDTLVVAGGQDANGAPLGSVEVLALDPPPTATSTFRVLTQTMTVARDDLFGVPLGESEALLGGGFDGTHTLSSMERLSLASETFAETRQPLAVARRGATAFGVGGGRVVIVGGQTAAIELYLAPGEATSHGVTPEGDVPAPRAEQTATLLASGRVLVTGGTDGSTTSTAGGLVRTALATAELYDPNARASDRFSQSGSLHEARRQHAAAALSDGRAVVIGGLDAEGAPLASIELFDPAASSGAGAFATSSSALPAGMFDLAAVALADGRVLVCGGQTAAATSSADAFIFDPQNETLTATSSMQAARAGHALVLLTDGRVLAAGGDPAATAELFDPKTGAWTQVVDPTSQLGPARRDMAAARLLSGRVLLAGGRTLAGAPSDAVAVFDPSADSLTALAPLSVPRAGAVAFPVATEEALIAGGEVARSSDAVSTLAATRTASIERYDATSAGATRPADDPDLSSPVSGARLVILQTRTGLLLGGRGLGGAVRAAAETIAP